MWYKDIKTPPRIKREFKNLKTFKQNHRKILEYYVTCDEDTFNTRQRTAFGQNRDEETDYFTPNTNRRTRTGIWPDTTSVTFLKWRMKAYMCQKKNKSNKKE